MEKIEYNYNKLRGMIREVFKTQEKYADFLGISEGQLYKIFNGSSYFNQAQISKTALFLNSTAQEIFDYFFTEKVEQN